MVRAVLFDADGVLVDACELHYVALNRALATMGWEITRTEHLTVYNGLPTQRKLMVLTHTKDFPEGWHGAVHALKQDFTRQAIEECLTDAPEKRELLQQVRSCGLKIGVCSNSLHSTLVKMLEATGIRDFVDVVLGNDDVENPKPSPEIYLSAAKLLDAQIEECIIVEDSPVGLASALAAGALEVIRVEGPDEVDLSLMPRFERHLAPIREVA